MKRETSQERQIHNFPDDIRGVGRRQFIKGMLGGAAAFAALPSLGSAKHRKSHEVFRESAGRLTGSDTGDEAFWRLVKEHFLIRKDLIMLNAANLCPSPYPVQQMVFDLTRDVDRDASFANRNKFGRLREESRNALAEYLGASPDEIAITRNTSEGNNIVISGLTFRKGDEVIIWDENHPTANVAWDVRADRYGFKVKRVKVPARFETADALIEPFRNAMNNRTRIVCFSHVSNISGIALPAKEICRMARDRNILTHIDGAQTFGSHAVDLHDIGCDFYTGSSHKWFLGPKEVGVLYVRAERIADVWPSIVGVGYQSALKKGAVKFETLGQRDDSRIAAMKKTVEFHNLIGKDRVEKRIRTLTDALMQKLKSRIPGIHFITPSNPEFNGGVVVFKIPGLNLDGVLNKLYEEHHIGCAIFGGDLAGIRMCPHIYNTMDQIDKAVDAVASLG